jgi:DNA-binding response OmpR family regulator
MTRKILLIENPAHTVRPLRNLLTSTFHVDITESVTATTALTASNHYVATLLNGGLASPSNLVADVCTLNSIGVSSILALTDHGAETSLTKFLKAGAWDCLPGTIPGAELIARINSLVQWSRNHNFAKNQLDHNLGDEVIVGDMHIFPSRQSVTIDGRDLKLPQREFDLLLILAQRQGEVITRRNILESLWGTHRAKGKRVTTVNVYLNRLRNRLDETGSHPRYLHTVYGAGVKLEAPRAC